MIVAVVLSLLAAIFVVLPLLPRRQSLLAKNDQRRTGEQARVDHNRRVHAEQLAELAADLEEGKIDQPQFAELEQELLAGYAATDRSAPGSSTSGRGATITLMLAALALVIASFASYMKLGHQADVETHLALQEFLSLDPGAEEQRREALLELLPLVESRSSASGAHLGWRFMLAQMQSQLQRYAEAAASYRLILNEDESNADVWAEYAQATYLSNARRLSEPVQKALQKALSINPHQRTALSLRGMHAFENKDFSTAEQSWSQLLAGLQPGTEYHRLISSARNRAQQQLAEAGGGQGGGKSSQHAAPADTEAAALPANTEPASTESAETVISVDVELAETIALPATTTVFVYARAAQGPRMPLAIQRLTIADLPTRINLDDSMAMMPAMRLSMFDEIEVLARVSESGSPSPQAGDWQASSGSLQRSQISAPLSLRIAQQLP